MKTRKALLSAIIFGVMLLAVSCGPKDCKADDCSEEVYKKGYCELHYSINELKDEIGDLGGLFD